MKQVVQSISGGSVRVLEVPRPTAGPTEVLVQTLASIISPGTERAVTALAQSSLLSKARARPDLVRQVMRKAKTQGIVQTARTVRDRLDEDLPLGYSAAGIALQVGEYVSGVAVGQLVATGGAGKANHADYQAVPGLLTVSVPDGVSAEDAAFATIGSIALHGLRLADLGPGSKVVIIGLGLLGQLAVRIALAAGYDVAGVDISDFAVQRASDSGCFSLLERGDETTATILHWSRGRGADAVLLTASSSSSAAAMRAPALCRDGATVVVVGDIGLGLERRPFYEKELSIRFARAYGPGRYDRSYEEWSVDYPVGQVRWTEGRNLETILDLLAMHRLRVDDLVTHRYPIVDASAAYSLIERNSEPYVGVALSYDAAAKPEKPIYLRSRRSGPHGHGVGLIGAGAFASSVLVPALQSAGFDRFVSVASTSGLSARRLAERAGFEKAVSGGEAVISDPDVDVVIIATSHESHAQLAARALQAGKHVFCEKPLALTLDELDDVETAWRDSGAILFVGFNRRFSPAIQQLRSALAGTPGPLVITYRVSAGTIGDEHWYHDRRQGGRLIGEVCHFVDTCAAIIGEDAQNAIALSTGSDERLLHGEIVLALRYPGGSLAAITYATNGHERTGKEFIEVLGRGHTLIIDDFTDVSIDGSTRRLHPHNKGHLSELAMFRSAIDRSIPTGSSALTTTRTVLEAVCSLEVGPRV